MINFGVRGKYKLEKFKDGKSTGSTEWVDNMVLNSGLVAMLRAPGGDSAFVVIRPVCGTGSAPVSPTDTSLSTFRAGGSSNASSNVTTRNATVSPYYIKHAWVWQFTAGSASGNITEVGAALTNSTPNSSTPLFSRALVTDSSGAPSSITVLEDEVLQITYELFIYVPGEATGSFTQTIHGTPVTTDFVIRPALLLTASDLGAASSSVTGFPAIYPAGGGVSDQRVQASSGSIGTVTEKISGTLTRMDTVSADAPNPVTFTRDVRYGASLPSANISISAVYIAARMCAFQFSMSPPVVKTNEDVYTFTLRFSVARA